MRKSGDAKYDQAALKALNDASGKPTPYSSSLGERVEFELIFN